MQGFSNDIRSFPRVIRFRALSFLLSDRRFFGDSFMGNFLLGTSSVIEASRCVFSPQISALWRLCVVTDLWFIWDQRNKIIFEGFRLWDSTLWANFWAFISESGQAAEGSYGQVCSMATPPIGFMKINVDGSAAESPGQLTGGGIFRDHYDMFRGCFAATHGYGFAFEAELATALLAIELAHDKGWNNLWLESDSTYVVHFLKSDLPDVPWRLMARWHRVRRLRPHLHIVVSHIFQEGNAVADRLSREEVSRFKWWSESLDFLFPFLQRDIGSEFYRFTRF
ncbi:hypothetical protein ACS0TY_027527 [Phlomoides rotata]